MDPIVLFLKEDILLEEKSEAKKVRRNAPQFWLSENQKLYNTFVLGLTFYAFILRRQNYFLKSYMKGFVEATLEVDLCLTEPSLRATGG